MSSRRTSPFLLRTKLHHPRIASDAVTRARLAQRFGSPTSLMLVVAPAGYGKTTFLSMWAEQCPLPNAWLSLDAYDNNLDDFLTYFVCAIQTLFPAFGNEVSGIVHAAPNLPPSTLARMVLDACDEISQQFILILDDYQLIHEKPIHQLLSELLRHPSPWLHLVIASRNDPPLPLAVLRGHGSLTEIRAHDLRFTDAETQQLFQDAKGTGMALHTVQALTERTEGWAAGLHLARVYTRQQMNAPSVTEALEVSSRQITEYLATEVLECLPSRVKTFLMRTSILDQLCAGLCAAVVGEGLSPTESQEMLYWLEANGVFVTALSDQDEWFKVHSLFQSLLRTRLNAVCTNDEINVLHRRAGAWHLQHKRRGDAIRHTLAAGDVSAAVQIVADGRPAVMNRGEWHRLHRWLSLFPKEVIERQPQLLMAQAWLMHSQFRRGNVREIIERVQELLPPADPDVPPLSDAAHPQMETSASFAKLEGELETLRTFFSFWNGDMAEVLRHGHLALEKTPQSLWYVRALAVMFFGIAHLTKGDLAGALELYESLLRQEVGPSHVFRMQVLTARGFFQLVAGELGNLARDADYMLALSGETTWAPGAGWARYFQAVVHYQRNELAAVEQVLSGIVGQRYWLYPQCFTLSVCLLGLTYHHLERNEEADAIVQTAISYLIEIDHTLLLPEMRGFQAELALRQGDLERATQIAATLPATLPAQIPYPYAYPVTLAKLFLMQNSAESLQSARKLLRKLHDYAMTMGNRPRMIEALILETWERQIEGDSQRALQALAEAVELAAPAGFIRLFIDLGYALDPLLAQLAEQGVEPPFVSAIRAAIRPAVHPVAARLPAPAPLSAASAIPQVDVSVLLTFREQDVLRLLGQRRTNHEIAQELSISPDTVKRHTINIFRKLHLNNRREAAALAAHLNSLPHHASA